MEKTLNELLVAIAKQASSKYKSQYRKNVYNYNVNFLYYVIGMLDDRNKSRAEIKGVLLEVLEQMNQSKSKDLETVFALYI